MLEEEPESREADENVDNSFRLHILDQRMNDVPVRSVAERPAEADEAPVECSDDSQNERDHVQCFHMSFFVYEKTVAVRPCRPFSMGCFGEIQRLGVGIKNQS